MVGILSSFILIIVLSFVERFLLVVVVVVVVVDNGFINVNLSLEMLGFLDIDFFVVVDYFVGSIKLIVDSVVIIFNFVDFIIGFVLGIVLDENVIFIFIVGMSEDFNLVFLVFRISLKILNLDLVI